MSLLDALNVIFTVFSGIIDVIEAVTLFGLPLSVYFIAAFVVDVVMDNVFGVSSSSGSQSKSKEKASK